MDFELVGLPSATIGRSPRSDAALTWDRMVSREHAQIILYGADWEIDDRESRNGTYVNGELVVDRRRLRSGDRIQVGATMLRFGITQRYLETRRVEGATFRPAEPTHAVPIRSWPIENRRCRHAIRRRSPQLPTQSAELVVNRAIGRH